MKKVLDFIVFVLTGKGAIANEAIEAGILSYEGQGRDKYGNWGRKPSRPGQFAQKQAKKFV